MHQPGRTWIFDLDNTLHNATPYVFPHINRAMTDYIQRHLALDETSAQALRQHYWQRYGATLLGLMRHHSTNPHHFLQETHQFPDLKPMLVFDRGLRHLLRRRLPGKKIIFSNAPLHYSGAVLELMGIADCFDAHYSVERVRFHPKPDPQGFRLLLRAERLDPRHCVMVEDSLANLETAKKLGMKTVLVSASLRRPPCVDVILRSVMDLPRHLARL